MKQELREQLGKSVHQAIEQHNQHLVQEHGYAPLRVLVTTELEQQMAEAAVSSFVHMLMPGAQNILAAMKQVATPEQRAQIDDAVEAIRKVVEE